MEVHLLLWRILGSEGEKSSRTRSWRISMQGIPIDGFAVVDDKRGCVLRLEKVMSREISLMVSVL